MIHGHCECGRVRYEVDGDIKDFSHCHCSQCRRLHGAAFATFAGVATDQFRYVSGESDTKVYASSPSHNRVFCAECGSNILVSLDQEPDTVYLSMSAIEGDPPRPPGYHIFVGSKADWYEIRDDLAQYETEPPE
ncbi:MAG: GFA family protein [Gammaproteobacteria bacterium]|nr:GFA family protein [Gammaproteobacteria bacterium]